MGRNVKIRANYNQDAQFLTRLQDAVNQDPKASDEFKRYVYKRLQEVITVFMLDKEHFEEFISNRVADE